MPPCTTKTSDIRKLRGTAIADLPLPLPRFQSPLSLWILQWKGEPRVGFQCCVGHFLRVPNQVSPQGTSGESVGLDQRESDCDGEAGLSTIGSWQTEFPSAVSKRSSQPEALLIFRAKTVTRSGQVFL